MANKTHDTINKLWREMETAITEAFKAAKDYDDPRSNLKDYARGISWHDDLAGLLGRECANERQHRSGRSVRGYSVQDAAKTILMGNVLNGASLAAAKSTLDATRMLVVRHTAFEAEIIGYLIHEHLSSEWRTAVANLDYADQMKRASA